MQWIQYAVDAVCSGHSRIVVYGSGDIVFDTKRSNQRMQWTQYVVRSRIVVNGGRDIVFYAKRSNQRMQWMQYAVDTVCSGCSKQWTQ